MSEDKEKAEDKSEDKEKSADEKFVDDLLVAEGIKKGDFAIAGIDLRPPTLSTLAILQRAKNALITGQNMDESEIMMQVLIFMYVHHAPQEEVHGACLMTPSVGRNLTLDRKALELGEKLAFKSPKDFVKLYEDLMKWLSHHMDLQVEPIPDDDKKGKPPNPNV